MDAGTRNWGRWGDDDERGTLNLVTDDVVRAAASVVRTGKVYSLALPLEKQSTPPIGIREAPQRLTLTAPTDMATFTGLGMPEGTGSSEDVLILPSHSVTHIDALCHAHRDGSIYNGFTVDAFEPHRGASRCAITAMGPLATRGVLLDVAAHAGVANLEGGHVITADELAACAAAQGTEIRAGDAVLVRTGYLQRWLGRGHVDIGWQQPGLGLSAGEFLVDHDVAAVGADNSAVEAIPFDDNQFMGLHMALLRGAGMPLIEHLALEDLAADGVHEFLFVCTPLPVPGATGSPVAPVAIA